MKTLRISHTVACGDVVRWNHRYHGDMVGVVVKGFYWPHIAGGILTVYCEKDGNLYGLDWYSGKVERLSEEERAANMERAREDYRKRLSVYPVWAERFSQGRGVGF